MADIASAVRSVTDRVDRAAARAWRDPASVRIVAAVKYADPAGIDAIAAAGIREVGENRAQRLEELAAAVSADVVWHYIGALQTNKVRHLAAVSLIHGLCREREAEVLQAHAERTGRDFDVLVQVNIAGEASKQGVAPEEVDGLLRRLEAYPRVRPRGFMFVAPHVENAEDVRWVFTEGRRIGERYKGSGLTELSMGMTDDFEVAIEEGATIVRIGRAIFGPPS